MSKRLCMIALLFTICSAIHSDIITDVFKRLKVYDTNKDGMINCIDYAVCFKRTYDTICKPYHEMDCEIVRNEEMQHLFIRARDSWEAPWVYIEPQGTYSWYLMEEVWGDRYNCAANVYGETRLWLTGVYK